MKKGIVLILAIITAISFGCSTDSVDNNDLNEESIDNTTTTNRSLEFLDGGDSGDGSNLPPPSNTNEVAVLVVYPDHYSQRDRGEYAIAMNNHFTIYSRHRPAVNNPFGPMICGNVVKWMVNEEEYDAYIASLWPPPPTDGAGGQPYTNKQETDDDDDQPRDPRWGCF